MSSRFNDDECHSQLIFCVTIQNVLQFGVDCIYGRGLDTEINHAATLSIQKDKPAKIAIPRHQDTLLLGGNRQQICVNSRGPIQGIAQ